MHRKYFLFAVMCVCSPALFADNRSAAQDLLDAATQQSKLLDKPDHPFLLDIGFTAQVYVSTLGNAVPQPTQGHLRFRVQTKDVWWTKVSLGGFEQVRFQKGEMSYTLRNLDFTPERVDNLMALLRILPDDLAAQNVRRRMEGVTALDCISAHLANYTFVHHEICVDSATHDIVRDTETYPDGEVVKRFSDFADFEGHRYPRKLEQFRDGRLQLSATVAELNESPLDPQLLVAPKGAIERRICVGEVPPKPIDGPHPDSIPGHHSGMIEAELTILPDGTVGDVHLAGLEGRPQVAEWLAAVKRWKFKPAMCGSEPVVADVDFSFQMSGSPF